MELQNNKERQAAGIALAKQRGVYKGRKKGTTKLDPEEVMNSAIPHRGRSPQLKEVTPRTVKSALARKRLTKKKPA